MPDANDSKLDTFRAAYRVWKAATNDHEVLFQSMINGARAVDSEALFVSAAEVTRTLNAFTEASRPFVGWK